MLFLEGDEIKAYSPLVHTIYADFSGYVRN
jgi:hypothetical protein